MVSSLNAKQNLLLERLNDMGYEVNGIENYHNVEDILTIKCKNGHKQTKSITNFQKNNWECIECLKLQEKNIQNNEGFLLSLDAATKTTGWAIFNCYGQLIKSGYYEAKKTAPLMERIHSLVLEIERLVKENNIKFLAVEDTYMEINVNVFKTLSMLRGILLYYFEYQKGLTVYSAEPDGWRSFSNIRGANRNERKRATVERGKMIYDKEFEEDEADAIFLGRYAYSLIPLDKKGALK